MTIVMLSRVELCAPCWAWPHPSSKFQFRNRGLPVVPVASSSGLHAGWVALGKSLSFSGPRWLLPSLPGTGEPPELQVSDRSYRQEGYQNETHGPYLSCSSLSRSPWSPGTWNECISGLLPLNGQRYSVYGLWAHPPGCPMLAGRRPSAFEGHTEHTPGSPGCQGAVEFQPNLRSGPTGAEPTSVSPSY